MNGYIWLVILGMGVITYALRLSMLVLLERVQLTDRIKLALGFVPTAVLSALVFPELFYAEGVLQVGLGNGRLWAGLIAGVVAWRTKNVLVTIVVGMVVLWLWQWGLG